MKSSQIFDAIANDIRDRQAGKRARTDCHGETAKYIMTHTGPEHQYEIITLLGTPNQPHVVHSVVRNDEADILSDTAPDGYFDTGLEYQGAYPGGRKDDVLSIVGEMTIGEFLDRYHGKFHESNQSLNKDNLMSGKTKRKLSFREAALLVRTQAKKESAKKRLRIYAREDDEGQFATPAGDVAPEGSYFASVDTSTLPPDGEISVGADGGGVCIGPFDSPEDATALVGSDVEVTSADGAPAMDAPPMDDFPMEKIKLPKKATIPEMRKAFRDAVMKEADAAFEVDTDAANADGATDMAAGAVQRTGAPGVANQSPSDAGSSAPLDTPAEEMPNTDGIPGVEKTGTDGTLQSNGGSDGLSESTAGLARASLCMVKEKQSGKKVDAGMVEKVQGMEVTLAGGKKYSAKDYTFVNLS